MTFDTVIMVDWSGGNDRGASPKKDAIWTCIARNGQTEPPLYHRNRQIAERYLIDTLTAECAAGRRTLAAFDLCFAYPTGFAKRLIGTDDPLALWDWFAARVTDTPKDNNRFALAGQINTAFPGIGPFWGNGRPDHDVDHLPRKGRDRSGHGLPEHRATDRAAPGAFSPWQLSGAGAVGGQVIMGLPMLSCLRHHFAPAVSVWPFQPPDTPIVLAETYFSLLPASLLTDHPIRDAAQVMLYARAFSALTADRWHRVLAHDPTPEGWVLGLGHADLLQQVARPALIPPPLRNDCFAMPQGTHWTPVDDALAHLRGHLAPVTGTESLPLMQAAGRILAAPVTATRSHPPQANAAVDGYAFAGPLPAGPHTLPLHPGRAAAGQPFAGIVPRGHAIRILTGANIPAGTDTVVLQEDTTASPTHIALHGPLKQRANARRAGEDMTAGDVVLPARRRLTPADLATLAACGTGTVTVHTPLRVGVLSTGDELRTPGDTVTDGQIHDANRAMLLANIARWGHQPIDLGIAPDDRRTLRAMLDAATATCDAILTSGGASAGEEDHMSALLQGTGTLALWRIAMKPGRPLALGLWHDTPVFGLPGNPVAAQICALVFAYPALALLAGSDWATPQGFSLPADFTKSKKAGRREYLRARVANGRVAVFASEGSGRVSGLSWATGLVELPDAAAEITPGTPVTYIPFGSFLL